MPITRSSEQGSMTLEEFYTDFFSGGHPSYQEAGKSMLQLISMINGMFPETTIWGLTSVARLVLQNEDNGAGEWYVILASSVDTFYIEYLLPESKRPWNNAYVHGEAQSLEQLRQYLLIAMQECGGWPDNTELKRLTET